MHLSRGAEVNKALSCKIWNRLDGSCSMVSIGMKIGRKKGEELMLWRKLQFGRAMLFLAAVVLTLAWAIPSAKAQTASTERSNVLFIQQDTVTTFDVATGEGSQTGTVTGKISGTSIVAFQFAITSNTTFNIENKVVITDLDGDQLRIRDQGTGRLIPSIDLTVSSLSSPMTGTYEVLGGTGKFQAWIGKIFRYRAVRSYTTDGLGTAYLEVMSNPIK